jgi:hypothetical protein
MFELIDGKVYWLNHKIATPSYILETEEMDFDITFETWFEEVDESMDDDKQDFFFFQYEVEWAPSSFRNALVNYARECSDDTD